MVLFTGEVHIRLLDGIHPLANSSLGLQAGGDEGYLRLQVIALDYKLSILVQVTVQFVQQIRDLVDNVGCEWRDIWHSDVVLVQVLPPESDRTKSNHPPIPTTTILRAARSFQHV